MAKKDCPTCDDETRAAVIAHHAEMLGVKPMERVPGVYIGPYTPPTEAELAEIARFESVPGRVEVRPAELELETPGLEYPAPMPLPQPTPSPEPMPLPQPTPPAQPQPTPPASDNPFLHHPIQPISTYQPAPPIQDPNDPTVQYLPPLNHAPWISPQRDSAPPERDRPIQVDGLEHDVEGHMSAYIPHESENFREEYERGNWPRYRDARGRDFRELACPTEIIFKEATEFSYTRIVFQQEMEEYYMPVRPGGLSDEESANLSEWRNRQQASAELRLMRMERTSAAQAAIDFHTDNLNLPEAIAALRSLTDDIICPPECHKVVELLAWYAISRVSLRAAVRYKYSDIDTISGASYVLIQSTIEIVADIDVRLFAVFRVRCVRGEAF
jgi:hypothetical protein